MMKNSDERGQALIELIVFLPLIVTLYSVIAGYANSINGSINQQKIARAYFYNRIQNSSTFPGPRLLKSTGNSYIYQSWKQFGFFFIGWKDYFTGGEIPVMPCYKVSIPFKDSPDDKCEQAYSDSKTLWVRVGTVYGVCGATYMYSGNQVYYMPDNRSANFVSLVDRSSCLIE